MSVHQIACVNIMGFFKIRFLFIFFLNGLKKNYQNEKERRKKDMGCCFSVFMYVKKNNKKTKKLI